MNHFLDSGQCDLQSLLLPANANEWTCNKAVNQGKVSKNTKCKLDCLEGHDLIKGLNNDLLLV